MIEVKDKFGSCQIYRHSDGYPEGVLADVKILLESTEYRTPQDDPEYFLANLIFFCKLNGQSEIGYGVTTPGQMHGDEDYRYIFAGNELVIERHDWEADNDNWRGKEIFRGTLEQAYTQFPLGEFPDGCHIDMGAFKAVGAYLKDKEQARAKARAKASQVK
jgi:hypothetical protein